MLHQRIKGSNNDTSRPQLTENDSTFSVDFGSTERSKPKASNRWICFRKSGFINGLPTPMRRCLVVLSIFFLIILLILAAHESFYYVFLNRIRVNHLDGARPSDLSVASSAVVSGHHGLKFCGYLGSWLRSTKKAYAGLHSYAYHDDRPPPSQANDFATPWHRANKRYFDKLRVLLHLLLTHDNLKHILWIDGDAVIANPQISILEKVQEIVPSERKQQYCLIWAKDLAGPNAGIILLSNTPTTHEILKKALVLIPKDPTFADQSALAEVIASNQSYRECAVALPQHKARLLQSRVKGPSNLRYQDGDWILHLPNHNRWEMLWSLFNSIESSGNNRTNKK